MRLRIHLRRLSALSLLGGASFASATLTGALPTGAARAQTADYAPAPAPIDPSAPEAAAYGSGLESTSPAAIGEMERRLAAIDREIDAARKELEGIGPAKSAADVRVHVRGRLLYKLLRAGLMPLSGGFDSFVDHAQRVERLKRALTLDLAEESRLATRGGALVTELDALSKERKELAGRKDLAEAARVAIDEERRRREAFERAFATSLARAPKSDATTDGEIVVYGPSGKTTPESLDPAAFKSRKGRLTFPVSGQAEVKATTREGGPAVEIRATLGATVRAVHAGRVAFADRYGTYGSLVILDHGERYYTVSGNLGSIDVKVGDEISAGEKIGTVGDDGRGPALYFEIRKGNDKLPPQAWLGL